MTTRSNSTRRSGETSERGFQKVSGRKIPSVLRSGGDGYGGGLEGAAGEPSSSRPQQSPTYSPTRPPHGLQPPSAPPPVHAHGAALDSSYTREQDELHVRPSPARTPASSTNVSADNVTSVRHPSQVPDLVGRSRPSLDESRGSRFTESI